MRLVCAYLAEVEAKTLAEQDGDRSERGVLESPTLQSWRPKQFSFPQEEEIASWQPRLKGYAQQKFNGITLFR